MAGQGPWSEAFSRGVRERPTRGVGVISFIIIVVIRVW